MDYFSHGCKAIHPLGAVQTYFQDNVGFSENTNGGGHDNVPEKSVSGSHHFYFVFVVSSLCGGTGAILYNTAPKISNGAVHFHTFRYTPSTMNVQSDVCYSTGFIITIQ